MVRNVVLHGLRLKPPGAHPIHCPLELIKLMAASFSPVERRPTFHHIVHTLESIIDSVQADIEAGHAAADALVALDGEIAAAVDKLVEESEAKTAEAAAAGGALNPKPSALSPEPKP